MRTSLVMKELVIGGAGGVERAAVAHQVVLDSGGRVGAVPVVETVIGAVREDLVRQDREVRRRADPVDRVRREIGLRAGAGSAVEATGVARGGEGVQGLPDAIVVPRLPCCPCPS